MFQAPASGDIWCVEIEQLWFEFIVVGISDRSVRRRRTVPFVDSFPVVVWMSPLADELKVSTSSSRQPCRPSSLLNATATPNAVENTSSSLDVCLLLRAGIRDIRTQIDHKRFAFIMSLVDTIVQVKEEIDMDLASAGMTSTSGVVFLSASTTDFRVDLVLAPVDDYAMRPASPDDEDDDDDGDVGANEARHTQELTASSADSGYLTHQPVSVMQAAGMLQCKNYK
jgi:hypothetical protein